MYFDYAATSIKRSDVINELVKNLDEYDGNPSSMHALGRSSKKYLEKAREIIAKSINAKIENIIFTSGASESNSMIIRHFIGKNKEIITSSIEHKSILENLENERLLINVKKTGIIDIEELKAKITHNTKLIAIMYVNNETGVIQPVEEIGKHIKELNKNGYNIHYHIDAVQALGHVDIDVEKLNCDSLSLSGHKIGGFNGFGVLFINKRIDSLIKGGSQENSMRAGTSNVLAALSMANSINKLQNERTQIKELKEYFLEKLDIPYEINGDITNSVNHIINLYFPFVESDLLLTFLDLNGICASAGSACNAGSLEPSYVIENMYDKERAKKSIRFSFGFTNTKQDVDQLVEILNKIYKRKLGSRD